MPLGVLEARIWNESVVVGRGRGTPGPYSARDCAFGWASGVARPRVPRAIEGQGAVASIFWVQRDPMMRLCVFKHSVGPLKWGILYAGVQAAYY